MKIEVFVFTFSMSTFLSFYNCFIALYSIKVNWNFFVLLFFCVFVDCFFHFIIFSELRLDVCGFFVFIFHEKTFSTYFVPFAFLSAISVLFKLLTFKTILENTFLFQVKMASNLQRKMRR